MSSSGGSNPELNIEECKFQASHPLYESMIPGTTGLRISQDGQGRMEFIVRLMTVLLRLEMDVTEVVRLMCLSFVIGSLPSNCSMLTF